MTKSSYAKRFMLGMAAVALGLLVPLLIALFVGLVGGGIARVAGQIPPPFLQQPCGGAIVWGNGGYQCDGPPGPDGSFQRCTAVYVLGIGGMGCYMVYP